MKSYIYLISLYIYIYIVIYIIIAFMMLILVHFCLPCTTSIKYEGNEKVRNSFSTSAQYGQWQQTAHLQLSTGPGRRILTCNSVRAPITEYTRQQLSTGPGRRILTCNSARALEEGWTRSSQRSASKTLASLIFFIYNIQKYIN